MGRTVFITGAGGFIGKALVARLLANGAWQIKALIRRPIEQSESAGGGPGLSLVIGDLNDPITYRASLEGVDTVIHLAAVVGKAPLDDYVRTNIHGTRKLLEACKEANVRSFLHVSTIAAKYADQNSYPYARTKAFAETLVRESGIPSVIIRPTLVLGASSSNWKTISRLVKLPLIPLPNGGRVLVQPVHVDNLIQGFEVLLAEGRFDGEVLEFGGPDPIRLADFICAIHREIYGRQPRLIAVPLTPIRALLELIEPMARSVLPVTAGQLGMFGNNGTVSPNWLHDRLKSRLYNVEQAISRVAADAVCQKNPSAHGTRAHGSSGAGQDSGGIDRECDVFSRYLVSEAPTEYILKQYKMGAVARGLANDDEFSAFDRVTLKVARLHAWCTRFADAYCALFVRCGALRRKLILLLAILEHTAPTADQFDRPKVRGWIGAGMTLFIQALTFGFLLIAATVLLFPAQLITKWQGILAKRGNKR